MTRAGVMLAALSLYGLGMLGGLVLERKTHHCPAQPVRAEDFRAR